LEAVSGGRTKLAVLFALVGVFAGLGAAVGVDMVDRRVRTTGQVRSIMGFPPLASFLEPSADPARQALMADQMRRLAMVLGREHSANDVRRVLVTSACHGSGATTVVLDLGRELARQGLRVLVVEANLLIPDPRYRDEAQRPTLVDVLNTDSDPFAAISPSTDVLPDRIATGSAANGHLSDCARLGEVITKLSENYDLMLIDAAPIRLSADTEYLISVCDAAWLVVRAMHARIGEVKGSASRLEKAAPPAVGLIMTGLTVFRGGGYYAELLKEYRKVAKERRSQSAVASVLAPEDSAPSLVATVTGEHAKPSTSEPKPEPKPEPESAQAAEPESTAGSVTDETAWALEHPVRRWRRPGVRPGGSGRS
jgi:Mrp family chromosome partitioning ATPase